MDECTDIESSKVKRSVLSVFCESRETINHCFMACTRLVLYCSGLWEMSLVSKAIFTGKKSKLSEIFSFLLGQAKLENTPPHTPTHSNPHSHDSSEGTMTPSRTVCF